MVQKGSEEERKTGCERSGGTSGGALSTLFRSAYLPRMPVSTETLLVVGDRVLVRPEDPAERTRSGLYLPAGVQEGDRVRGGRVVKTGPGHVMPNPEFSDGEPWAPRREAVRYLPLQARPGDYALFLRKEAVELEWEGEAYLIVPHGAILALARHVHPEDLTDDLPGGLA